jgi:hypothetical protein
VRLPHWFCQNESLCEMVCIDALATSVRFAYCTTHVVAIDERRSVECG